jgi:hypothetical protein
VVTIPVKREPSGDRADITRPSPCPPPNATTLSRSAKARFRIKILQNENKLGIKYRITLKKAKP